MSFSCTITDHSGDSTSVYTDHDQVTVKVTDQALAEYLIDSPVNHAYAIGVYTADQARELRDALDVAIKEVEGVFALVDEDNFVWFYHADKDRWHCAFSINWDGPTEDEWTLNSLANSIFKGFDSGVADLIERFGIQA
jgi:hypothetical protein